MKTNRPIYLDYNATTPHAPEVAEAISFALETGWGNPSSDHAYGREAAELLVTARKQVADLLNCAPDELIFTSGGTESNNTALIGCAEALESKGKHIVTSTMEHPAVDSPCVHLEQRGWEVTRVSILPNGTVDPERFVDALKDDTTLATLMHANNETGVIQPIQEIACETRKRGIVFHTDAAQTVGKLNVDVEELGVDLLTLAGHKLYGPRGIGALFVRAGSSFGIYHHGAGHENGRRAGTENIPGIAGLGVASALAREAMFKRLMHLARLRSLLENELRRHIPNLVIHGERAARLPNTTFCSIPGIDGRVLIRNIQDQVVIAAGSACHAGNREPSGVLKEMGVPAGIAMGTVRISVGTPTTEEQILEAVQHIATQATRLKSEVD